MPDISREFIIRGGRMLNTSFGSVGGMAAIPAKDGEPAKAKLSISLPGSESEIKKIPLGGTFTLANGTWTVAEITGAGTNHWYVLVRRVD
ncbi:DUF6406 domain-containing protein [Streptomyces sp. NPDC048297]|uniref:DUF6406 domain-containing protein n=1 Tax=Streptomyces sp. NPDC048297 TaxID=3365531 RepID=UPI00372249A1